MQSLALPEHPFHDKYSEPAEITAIIFNISRRSVYNSCQRAKTINNNNEPEKKKLRLQNTPIVCDSFSIHVIRNSALSFYSDKKYPTQADILTKCLEEPFFPRIGITTLGKWMKENAKFKYMRMNRKPVYLERQDIVSHRERYLRSIKEYRETGYEIVYVDETWANPEQTPSKLWLFLLQGIEFREYQNVGTENQVLIDIEGYTGKPHMIILVFII